MACAAASVDGLHVAIARDGELSLYTIEPFVEIARAPLAPHPDRTLAFVGRQVVVHDGTRLTVHSMQQRLAITAQLDLAPAARLLATSHHYALLARPDELLIASCTSDTTTIAPTRTPAIAERGVGLENARFLTWAPKRGPAELWDAATRLPSARIGLELPPDTIDVGTTGKHRSVWIATSAGDLIVSRLSDGKTTIAPLPRSPQRIASHPMSAWLVMDFDGEPHAVNSVLRTWQRLDIPPDRPRTLAPSVGSHAYVIVDEGDEVARYEVSVDAPVAVVRIPVGGPLPDGEELGAASPAGAPSPIARVQQRRFELDAQESSAPRMSPFHPRGDRGDMARGDRGDMARGDMPRGDRGDMARGDMPRGDRGDMARGDMPRGDRGDMARGDRGDMARGDMARGDMARGDMPRGDMPRGDMARGDMPRADIPRADMPRADMSRADMPRSDMPRSDMPRSDRSDMPRSDMPRSEMPRSDMPRSDMPRSEGPRGDMPRSDMPRSERSRSDMPRGFGETPRSEMPRADMPRSEMPRSEMPRSEMPRSERPRSDMPRGDIPRGDIPRADMPRSDVPRSDVPRSDMPRSDMPRGEMPRADMPRTASHDARRDAPSISSRFASRDREPGRMRPIAPIATSAPSSSAAAPPRTSNTPPAGTSVAAPSTTSIATPSTAAPPAPSTIDWHDALWQWAKRVLGDEPDAELPAMSSPVAELADRARLDRPARRILHVLYADWLAGHGDVGLAASKLVEIAGTTAWQEALGNGQLGTCGLVRSEVGRCLLARVVGAYLDGRDAAHVQRVEGGDGTATGAGARGVADGAYRTRAAAGAIARVVGTVGVGATAEGRLEAWLRGWAFVTEREALAGALRPGEVVVVIGETAGLPALPGV